MTFFLWLFSTFITTEFLIAACYCCRNIKLLCHVIILLSCTVESKLYVMIDFENVATYFLPLSLSPAELFVTTLKSLSRLNCLDLSHCSSNFYRDIIFFCCDKYFSLCSSLCHNINLNVETKLYCHLLDHCRDRAK